MYTRDPYLWSECHFTSDPRNPDCIENPFPTQDYTSNPATWKECDPVFTRDQNVIPCNDERYTTDAAWPWCDPAYTTDVIQWPLCHFTSDPATWPTACREPYPTVDFTWDSELWPRQCGPEPTRDQNFWCNPEYTSEPRSWPWCAPGWTFDPEEPACASGYTRAVDHWPECRQGQYTQAPATWPECEFYTGDVQAWPECHSTSDPATWPECGEDPPFPTKDYTTDARLWPECEPPPADGADLGDAPDSTNHAAMSMTAYPAGGPPGVTAQFPTVFDPVTGLPKGPLHRQPRADAWLGPRVTLERDADLLPDEDTVTNLDPRTDKPDRDKADDGVKVPVPAPHCIRTFFKYTVTVAPGAPNRSRYVNVWFDWNRDGDWADALRCNKPGDAPEWAVQNHLTALGPGTHVLQTPAYLPWNPSSSNIKEIWMRISIAEQPAPVAAGSSLADGQGPSAGYRYGETEDYYFTPSCPPPVADFAWDPPSICTNEPVSFFDASTSSLPVTWAWNFGGLGTSTLQNPTFTFASAGTHSVSLQVTNACGSDTETKRLVVKDCPSQEQDYDIYMKDNDTDDGSVPSSSPWYIGPDVWVRHSMDAGTEHQNAIPGATNYVYVRVRNRMSTTVENITVPVYWANVALGTSWPASWSPIGSFNIASLAGGAQTVKVIPWNVPFTAAHFCLRARADAPKDPVGSGPDTVAPVDWPPNNNNIIQKNVNVVDYPEVRHCGFYSTTVHTDVVYFDAVNTKSMMTTVAIELDSSDFPLGSGQLILEPGSLSGRWTGLTNFDQTGPTLSPTGFPATMSGIPMTAGETARMTMTISAEVDDKFTVRVEERVDSTEVGGIEYVRDLPDCSYLPIITREH
jgi:PKD repeat protein